MTTITMAWEAFEAAIADAQRLHATGADGAAIQELLQHARELLDSISDELALTDGKLPEAARGGLEHMRERLVSLESDLVTKH